MNTIQRAQEKFDGLLPPPVSTSPRQIARQEWLHNAAELLVVFRSDVRVQRRMRPAQVVTQDQFALAVDEHVNGRLADCKVNTSALGWLVLAAQHQRGDKAAATELLGNSVHPQGMLWEIAERLLEPLADGALIAQAEDDLL